MARSLLDRNALQHETRLPSALCFICAFLFFPAVFEVLAGPSEFACCFSCIPLRRLSRPVCLPSGLMCRRAIPVFVPVAGT